MFACQCLNVSVSATEDGTELQLQKSNNLPRFDSGSLDVAPKPGDNYFHFFKEAIGPVHGVKTTIQVFSLTKALQYEQWVLQKCLNCKNYVYASNAADPVICLINSSSMITPDELQCKVAQDNYSPTYRILLNSFSTSLQDYYDKQQYKNLFSDAKEDNELLQHLRCFMRAETQAVNDRIARFTQQQNERLCMIRERAEQHFFFLSKTFVPDTVDSGSATESQSASQRDGTGEQKKLPADPKNSDPNVGSQIETPPPTPEDMPMSTGNSPPMNTSSSVDISAKQQTSSSGSSVERQSPASPGNSSASYKISVGGIRKNSRVTTLSYNNVNALNNNNNNNLNNNRGAISKPPLQQHSNSTNLYANQHGGSSAGSNGSDSKMGLSSFDSDCLFDIDGMDNEKSTLSVPSSDDEECGGYNDTLCNNNEEGMYIPRPQIARQSNHIAKSLPISMPKTMTLFRTNEEDLDEMNEDNVDIAASIKALARSAHGETVFGDLPRPQIQRFTSQI